MDNDFFAGKNVLVMGLGRFGGGVDAAKFAADRNASVVVTDLAGPGELAASVEKLSSGPNIEYHLGSHRQEDFKEADIVIVNPAVPLQNKFLKTAAGSGVMVTSQVGIFFELCPATIIGITGSNGKSTTTSLTVHLLRSTNRTNYGKVWLSGNIGNEPLLMLLDEIKSEDLVVLELSSFQIEQLAAEQKAPQVALLTNLLPNHLDRYGTFEKYCAAKELLFINQKPKGNEQPISIFNSEDEISRQWYEQYKKEPHRKCFAYSAENVGETVRKHFTLVGKCNLSDLAGAITIAGLFGVDDAAAAGCVGDFKALPHRLELVADCNGVRWFNDSKATTPQAAIAALEAFEEPACPEQPVVSAAEKAEPSRRVVLIAGGYDKKLPFEELAKVIAARSRAVILIGATAKKISKAVRAATSAQKVAVEICESLADAVNMANKIAQKGDVVLLSPACASFDMFDNYEQRGEEFVRLVRQLTT